MVIVGGRIAGLGACVMRQEGDIQAEEDGCTLEFGLNDAQYDRLQRFVAVHGGPGDGLTCQTVLEVALLEYLDGEEQAPGPDLGS